MKIINVDGTDFEVKDISDFLASRKDQFDAASEIDKLINNGDRAIQLIGSLKSGKREIIECLGVLRKTKSVIVYSTSLNRKDMQDQFNEFKAYNEEYDNFHDAIVLSKVNSNNNIIGFDPKKNYIIVLDENDYGDNVNQKFEKFYTKYQQYNNVIFLFVSATPFSLMSVFAQKQILGLNPPCVVSKLSPSYQGLRNLKLFLIKNPAFQYFGKGDNKHVGNFSSDFEKIILSWVKQNVYSKFIVRDNGFQQSDLQKVSTLIRQLQLQNKLTPKVRVVLVDAKNSYPWMKDDNNGFELIIVKSTFTRGTETDIHSKLFGYYDNRGDNTALNTILQALGRFCGYLPHRSNNHITLYLSVSSLDIVGAYNYMEDELLKGTSISNIMSDLISVYSIEKFSKNTIGGKLQSTYGSSKGTWQYKVVSPQTWQQTANLYTHSAPETVRKIASALLTGQPADGQWDSKFNGGVVLNDIDQIINSVQNPAFAKKLEEAKLQFSLPSTGIVYLEGSPLPQINTSTATPFIKNNSIFNKFAQNGII